MIVVRGPQKGIRGQNVMISDIVKNQGTAGTGSFRVGFYLSKDSTMTTSDIFLGSRWVSSLAPGAVSQGATQVSIPAGLTLGTYYIGAIANDTSVITETNELNNSLAGNRINIIP
jgi:subtilase family serine protease